MKLTFRLADLKALLAHAESRWPDGLVQNLAEQLDNKKPTPGFWIVGDEGVYLMHNGRSGKDERQPVAYAFECNPKTLPFDTWWDVKRATFGGDDGVDEICNAAFMRQAVATGCDLQVRFTATQMDIVAIPARPEPKRRAAR